MRVMNVQRWIALGMLGAVIACVASSNLWLSLIANVFSDDEAASSGAPVAEGAITGEEADGAEVTPTGIVSIEDIVSGQAMLVEEPQTEVDPLIAELLDTLNQETFAIGEEPYIARAGDFVTIDSMRRAEGTASIYQIGESRRVLRLDPFSVTTGPDLRVLLSRSEAPRTSAEALLPNYLDLGALQSTSGAQNYEIPADDNFDRYKSVVIYSMSLNIIYSTATLQEVRGR